MQNELHSQPVQQGKNSKTKFFIGGAFILAALIYLIISSTQANAQYFYTVDELVQKKGQLNGRELRVSGAVLGSSIHYDADKLLLTFEMVQIPGDNAEIEAQGGLASVLHAATLDPTLSRIKVVYNGPRPDLLSNEAQAIVTGKLDSNGVFQAEELLLKCPSRYEEELPSQAAQSSR